MAFAALGDTKRAWDLYSLINPVNHGRNQEMMARYAVEPYVVAADVYAVSPHIGRGGWTWYTGSAGWTYRLIVESLLGLTRSAKRLGFDPRLPVHWESIRIDYRYCDTLYHITMHREGREGAGLTTSVDGIVQPDADVLLVDDGLEHHVVVSIRAAVDPPQAAGAVIAQVDIA
jgi:cellobiose phosphorylase